MKNIITILFYLIVSFSVSAQKGDVVVNPAQSKDSKVIQTNTIITPNGISINDTLMYDYSEVTNTFWKEFMHWVKTLRGEDSNEYKAVTPDLEGDLFSLSVLADTEPINYSISKENYLHFPEYDYYPVTGITLDQAKQYCQWRSDRVLEMLLIEYGIIKPKKIRKGKSFFTIEKFLTHKKYREERKLVSHYPMYFIPDSEDWDIIVNLIRTKSLKVGRVNSADRYQTILNETGMPLIEQFSNKNKTVENVFHDVLGNVSELIDGDNQCAGGNINDSTSIILKMEINKCQTPNKFVGFRCLSKWVKI